MDDIRQVLPTEKTHLTLIDPQLLPNKVLNPFDTTGNCRRRITPSMIAFNEYAFGRHGGMELRVSSDSRVN